MDGKLDRLDAHGAEVLRALADVLDPQVDTEVLVNPAEPTVQITTPNKDYE